MELSQMVVVIGAAGAVCSILFGYVGYRRGLLKDTSDSGNEKGALKANIEYIKRRTDDVLLEQRAITNTLSAHSERITRVEESAKQAHKRMDRLDKTILDE